MCFFAENYAMSSNENKTSYNSRGGGLEKSEGGQEKVGDAASDPETNGPAENPREKAAKSNRHDSSRDPT